MIRRALAAFLLAGCGYPQEEFAADYAEAYCQLYADCELLDVLDYESAGDCEADVEPTRTEDACPEYDRKAAKDCLDDLNAMECEALYDEEWPGSCDSACKAD